MIVHYHSIIVLIILKQNVPAECFTFAGGELAQVAGCQWTMRESGGSLAQNRWQGELSLTVSQEASSVGGMGAGLMDPNSPPNATSPIHLKLGHKERVWTGEYIEPIEVDEDIGVDGNLEDLEEDEESDDQEIDSECALWEEKEELEDWQRPFESQLQIMHVESFRHQAPSHDGDAELQVRDFPEHPVQVRLHGLREQRLKRWRRLRSSARLRNRLVQNWKTWRQRAQWVGSLGYRRARRWRQYSLYTTKKREQGCSNLGSSQLGLETTSGRLNGKFFLFCFVFFCFYEYLNSKLQYIKVYFLLTEKQFHSYNGYHGDTLSNLAVCGGREYQSMTEKPAFQRMELALTEEHRTCVQGL